MKRRNVLLGISGGLAAPAILKLSPAKAAANLDPNRLKSELMPLGGERAGSASGLVPVWTGGATTPPAGWTPDMPKPNLFPGQAPSFTVTPANMQQYAHLLSEGQVQMLNRYGAKGYKINVYPSARTAAAPQFIYDNTALNVTRIQPVENGIIYGFTGGYLGMPFPILSDDPLVAGAQCIWNHQVRWLGTYATLNFANMIGGNGGAPVLASVTQQHYWFPFYDQSLSLEQFEKTPRAFWNKLVVTAPPNQDGQVEMGSYSTNYNVLPSIAYEYLVGEGRIRQAPDINYDTPQSTTDDVVNVDEISNWSGKMDHYTWTLVGKKEMIVPYNQWAVLNTPTSQVCGPDTVDQDTMRYEVHRVWVVEAKLAPGKRDTMPHRFFYIDEDTWQILIADGYDSQGNFWKHGELLVQAVPDLPGTAFCGFMIHNFQSNAYLLGATFYADPPPIGGAPPTYGVQPHATWDPQSLANAGGL